MERLVDVKNLPTISQSCLLANVPLLPLTGFVHQILSSSTCLTHTCSLMTSVVAVAGCPTEEEESPLCLDKLVNKL